MAYGSISLDSAGIVAGGASQGIGVVGSAAYTGGTVSLSTQGVVAGSVSISTASTGDVHVIEGGQMNSSKTVSFAVDQDTFANTELSVFVKTP